MAKCRECNKEISRVEDEDICPYCGCTHPIDPSYETKDITSLTLDKAGEGYTLYRSKEKKKAFILCLLLGFTGVHNFYLGFLSKGIIDAVITLAFVLGVGLPLFFTVWPSFLAFLIPFFVCFAVFAAISFKYIFNDTLKDAKGEFLR